MADAHLFGHGAHTPVRGIDGTLFHGLLDDLEFDRCADWLPAGRFGATFHASFDSGFGEILLPAPYRGLGNADLTHDRHDAMTIRCHNDDPCARPSRSASDPRQLRHPQNTGRETLADKTQTLHLALHADVLLLAQPRRAALRRNHPTTYKARRFPRHRGTQGRNRRMD